MGNVRELFLLARASVGKWAKEYPEASTALVTNLVIALGVAVTKPGPDTDPEGQEE